MRSRPWHQPSPLCIALAKTRPHTSANRSSSSPWELQFAGVSGTRLLTTQASCRSGAIRKHMGETENWEALQRDAQLPIWLRFLCPWRCRSPTSTWGQGTRPPTTALPHKLRPLRAASPHDTSKHSHFYLDNSIIPRSLRSGGRFGPLISISVQEPNTTGAAACVLGWLAGRTSCPDMELLLTAPLWPLKYA